MVQSVPRSAMAAATTASQMLWRPSIIGDRFSSRTTDAGAMPRDHILTGGDLGKTLGLILMNKRKVLLATLASLLLGLTYLWLATPAYTSSASLFVDPRTRKVDEAVQGGMGADTTLLESQVALITSDSVLNNVIKRLKLASNPEFATESTSLTQALNGLFGRRTAATTPDELALLSLKKALKVSRAQKTYVLDISATSASPETAAAIVQSVIDAYFKDQIDAKSSEAKRANKLIDARLSELRDEVREAELREDLYKKSNKILTSEGAAVTEQQLTKLGSELVSSRAVAAETKARRDQIQAAIKSGVEPDVLADAARSGLLAKLREQYAQVARREASWRRSCSRAIL